MMMALKRKEETNTYDIAKLEANRVSSEGFRSKVS
jgi:hypothetical protein